MSKSKDADRVRDLLDWDWGGALDLLFQSGDASGVVNLLADGRLPRPWVCKMMARWRAEDWPTLPPYPNADHRRLIAAARVYRETKRRGEKAAARLERVAREFGPDDPNEAEVFQNSLDHFVNSRGGTHDRQADDWAEWERVYLGPDGTGFDKP
jgi:hypothetical protein